MVDCALLANHSGIISEMLRLKKNDGINTGMSFLAAFLCSSCFMKQVLFFFATATNVIELNVFQIAICAFFVVFFFHILLYSVFLRLLVHLQKIPNPIIKTIIIFFLFMVVPTGLFVLAFSRTIPVFVLVP